MSVRIILSNEYFTMYITELCMITSMYVLMSLQTLLLGNELLQTWQPNGWTHCVRADVSSDDSYLWLLTHITVIWMFPSM